MMEILDFYVSILSLAKPFLFFIAIVYLLQLYFSVLESNRQPKRKDVKGQVVLITGGASGLGRAIALRLAREGCNIVIADVDDVNGRKTVDDLKELGVKSMMVKVDVSKLDEVERLKKAIDRDIGSVNIVINNAGLLFARGIFDEDPILLKKMIDVNLMSHFWTTRIFLPDMIKRKNGHIASISSLAGMFPCPAISTYATTKYAVRGFMEALAIDLQHYGHGSYIKTTTAFPYFIKTNPELVDGYRRMFSQEFLDLLELNDATEQIVDAILREKEEVFVIKRNLKGIIAFYVLKLSPLWLRKTLILRTITKGYKWTNLNLNGNR